MNSSQTPETPVPEQGHSSVRVNTADDIIPGTSKVRLNVARLSDPDLLKTCKSHASATHDNSLFPDLTPSEEDYQFLIDDFSDSVTEIANLQLQLDAAYLRRDRTRGALEIGTRQRICYVQATGKGNPIAIMAGGFNVQRESTPIGFLSCPLNLCVTLKGEAGTMEVTWQAVKKKRGYFLQYAEGDRATENPDWTLEVVSKPKRTFTQMKLGTSYLFRVATIGGKGGQSEWSPIVVRVAG